jgi:glycosyltransferase involved in cell wall biosynthesis
MSENRNPVHALKVGVLIPDRNDRPVFLKKCLQMVNDQSVKPYHIELVNDPPLSDKKDITYRYRIGYDRMRNMGLDVIAFMENDDWYSRQYLEMMLDEWLQRGKPDLFGTGYTIYYHLKLRKYITMVHDDRASAMNTLIKPDMDFNWGIDENPFTDMHLWITIPNRSVWFSPRVVAVGMKHGIGKCGGYSHVDRLERYDVVGKPDNGFLERCIDAESFKFYEKFK